MEGRAPGVYRVDEDKAGRNKSLKESAEEFSQRQEWVEHTTFVIPAYQTLLVLRSIHFKEQLQKDISLVK